VHAQQRIICTLARRTYRYRTHRRIAPSPEVTPLL
jgi:hypothetical protein